MATHTQIIDLYGIPACGKTTLAEHITTHASGLKVASMRDCKHTAFKNKWKLAKSISLKIFLASVRLKCSAPFDKKRRDIPFKKILFTGTLKNYVRKYTDYDFVVTDSGDIQRIVSLERGDNLHKSERFRKACMQYLHASFSTIYVYCRIDATTALRRMNGRGRNNGRIDLISDQHLKLQELEKESKCFDFWTTILREQNVSLIELDMDDSTSTIADKLFSYISNLQLPNNQRPDVATSR